MTILFLTDSLSLPRDGKVEKVEYKDTYPYLLKRKYLEHDFIFLGIGGGTISDLYRQATYYKGIKPEIVFIQCGIVDCAPRAFSKSETRLINKLRLWPLFKLFKQILIKRRNFRFTSPTIFDDLTLKIKNVYFPDSNVIALGILPASIGYEQKLFGITNSIEKYNKILLKNLKFIDNSDIQEDGILSDFHHLNSKGHDFIFNKISNFLDK